MKNVLILFLIILNSGKFNDKLINLKNFLFVKFIILTKIKNYLQVSMENLANFWVVILI